MGILGYDPRCENFGQCEAPAGAKGITNCVDCGKELLEINGKWYTWDAYLYPNPKPQGRVK